MAMKDFNFKEFMLQKGEWVGLGLALVIVLPVLGLGMMKILSSRNPANVALTLDQLTRQADQRIQAAKPPPDADQPPKELELSVSYAQVDPEEYSTAIDWFIPSTIEDTRRRNPEILPAGDFHVDVVRGGMLGYILDGAHKRALVMQNKSITLAKDKRSKKLIKLSSLGGGAAGGMGRGPGMPGMGMPGMPGGERGMSSGGGMAGAAGGLTIPSTSWEDLDKIGTNPDRQLAEKLYPIRMAMVTGTFPFKQQMEEFRRALKKRSLDELFAMFGADEATWEFLPFKIQRRVLAPDGKEISPWEDYDAKMKAAFAEYFALAVDYEKEDDDLYKYQGLLNPGLVAVRPQLERGTYPKVELDSLKNAITALDKVSQGEDVKRPLSDLARKLQKKGVNPFDPFNPLLTEEEEEAKKPPEKPAPSDSSDKKSDKKNPESESELLIPEKALVRFLDVTVRPGLTYEYRIKVRMANPNYNKRGNLAYSKLADMKEIEASEWTLVPKVEVPGDIYYYVTDEKPGRDQAHVQIHRWVDSLLKDPQNPNSGTDVGDWTIADKLLVRRGEYLGRITETKVPVWNIQKDDFELAVNPKNRNDRKIPVDYTVRTGRALDPALLVDYQGGKDITERLTYRNADNRERTTTATDTVPVQMLILTPEGKLIVHSYQEDNSNEERASRFKAWKDWITDIETGRRQKKSNEMIDQLRGGGSGKSG